MIRPALLALLALQVAPAAAYERSRTPAGDPLEWGRRCVGYHLHEDGTDDVAMAPVIEAVQTSFQAWEAVECAAIEFHYQGLTNDNRVGYHPDRANVNLVIFQETSSAWTHNEGIIALTTATFCNDRNNTECPPGRLIDVDIELNGANFRFSTALNPRLVRFDLRNTLTHEVGHFLGLDHTSVMDATMFASAPVGERKKSSLHEDDRKGVCALYPDNGSTQCEPFEVAGDHFVDPAELIDSDEDDSGCGAAPTGAPAPWMLVLLCCPRRRRLGSFPPTS